MAKFRHQTPGSILASRRVIISDALADTGNTDFKVQQPANSTLDSVVFRCLDDITLASAGNVSFRVGISAYGGVDAVTSTTWASSQTSLAAGAVKLADGAAGVRSNNHSAVLATDERDLFVRLATTKDITTNGRIEATFVFRIFD